MKAQLSVMQMELKKSIDSNFQGIFDRLTVVEANDRSFQDEIIELKNVVQNEIKRSIDNHLETILTRLTVVESNVSSSQVEIDKLKKCQLDSASSIRDLNNVVAEIEERNTRSLNVLLFNISESAATSYTQKINDDLQHVMTILSPLGSFSPPIKVIRIGTYRPNYSRLLRLTYESMEVARSILRSNKGNPNKRQHFKPDLTKAQREYNNAVYSEFKDRISKGEADIMIKYRNNQPFIMKKTSNNPHVNLN
ncbi:hypothetical protein Zmor_014806 [Zophobas morio]|uniref:Uncharacterized protein n=1 Tax=Zophobas morio TaxID=2755281 RepID=A0AA38MFX0_9CUCU|nr:hypothetical protein Zmor_014774 [Zophobas morio]KAJ3655685.1 hypothetical protein Zmor_014806 [Zophobas morio]